MNWVAATLVIVTATALLLVPRRWAALPLLIGACYIPFYLGVQVGSLNFTAIRILIAVGIFRALLRHEFPAGKMNGIDRAMVAWSIWLVGSGLFHDPMSSALVFRLGLAYDSFGLYMLIRSFCNSVHDAERIAQQTAILMVPLAVEMVFETVTGQNLFSVLGGVGEFSMVREGKVRANGPFGHPILAGTVGAACLPLIVGLWDTHRKKALVGITACLSVIFASASSGPIMTAAAAFFGLWMWRYRAHVRRAWLLAIGGYIGLELIMKDPAYFIIARVDLAGGSTSWYRARLIQVALERLPQWWLTGTDYTADWMWVVVSWTKNHTDITSHYIQLGVWGGLPLVALFVLVLAKGFSGVTTAIETNRESGPAHAYFLWAIGSSLFALAISGFSVSYFDQSIVFVYLMLGLIGSASSHQPASSSKPPTKMTGVLDAKTAAGIQATS